MGGGYHSNKTKRLVSRRMYITIFYLHEAGHISYLFEDINYFSPSRGRHTIQRQVGLVWLVTKQQPAPLVGEVVSLAYQINLKRSFMWCRDTIPNDGPLPPYCCAGRNPRADRKEKDRHREEPSSGHDMEHHVVHLVCLVCLWHPNPTQY